MKNAQATKAMKAAWTNARKAAEKLGGKPSLYFVACLRDAWVWVKSQAKAMFNIGTIVRETEKAVMVEAELHTFAGHKIAQVWFPKSQIVDGKVPAWLMREKENELQRKYKCVHSIEIF